MKVEPSPRRGHPREEKVQESIGRSRGVTSARSERAHRGSKALQLATKVSHDRT